MKIQLWRLSLIAIIALVAACSQVDNVLDSDLFSGEVESASIDDLPSNALAFLTATYPGQSIVEVNKITTSEGETLFSAIMEDGTEYTFESRGDTCHHVAVDSLPQAILDYLDANYPNESVLRASQMENRDGETRYIVKLTSGEILAFDASGNLVAEEIRRGRHGRHGHHRHGTPVDIDSLSSDILNYVATNYPSETIQKAFSLTTKDGTVVFGVVLGRHNVLFFDENGVLLEDFRPSWRN